MLNPTQTVISQYQTAPIINAILADVNTNLDPVGYITSFYNSIWNILTANTYGLDVWGRIIGVNRNIQVPETFTFFSFSGTPGAAPFGAHAFFSGAGGSGAQITLTDVAYRKLLLLKAAANYSNCSVKDLNALIYGLYGSEGKCSVLDGYNMTVVYDFQFSLSTTDYAVLTGSGVLPRPAGVALTIQQGA